VNLILQRQKDLVRKIKREFKGPGFRKSVGKRGRVDLRSKPASPEEKSLGKKGQKLIPTNNLAGRAGVNPRS